jgi:lipid II:glycine glycyltransferase (peptidoglycan interpeptide bridge formation enzyme)
MKDIRQSQQFACFMRSLGWKSEKYKDEYIYLRKFPLFGHFAKMPRTKYANEISQILSFIKAKKVFKFKFAPFVDLDDINSNKYISLLLDSKLRIENEPFNPTTTIVFDLSKSFDELFDNFSEAKRRAVRRALKNNISIKITDDYNSFINIREKQYSPLGFMMTFEMKSLWESFYPKNARLLLAYDKNQPVAGILLLFYDNISYYWYASALNKGKKLFAPTLLVYEALKLSQRLGCRIFDFEGVYDERFPKIGKSWKGFTKFKEGFGGEKKILIENFTT